MYRNQTPIEQISDLLSFSHPSRARDPDSYGGARTSSRLVARIPRPYARAKQLLGRAGDGTRALRLSQSLALLFRPRLQVDFGAWRLGKALCIEFIRTVAAPAFTTDPAPKEEFASQCAINVKVSFPW
jgi:hypothetical protein